MCIYDFCVQIKITSIGQHFRFHLVRSGSFFFINLLNRSLNLQFAAATTTEVEASTAGPTSPTTVTPETTLTTGTEGGTIFLYIPL